MEINRGVGRTMKEDLDLGIRGNLQQGPKLQRNLIKTTHIDTNEGCLPSSLSLFLSAIDRRLSELGNLGFQPKSRHFT